LLMRVSDRSNRSAPMNAVASASIICCRSSRDLSRHGGPESSDGPGDELRDSGRILRVVPVLDHPGKRRRGHLIPGRPPQSTHEAGGRGD
jgi:hypothetical protein